jgi:hypothetical protein
MSNWKRSLILQGVMAALCDESATAAEGTAAPAAPTPETKDDPNAELKKKIVATFNNKVETKEVKFHFKKIKVKDEATGLETENKRPTVELILPVPSVEGIIDIFNAPDAIDANGMPNKSLSLLLEAIHDVVINRARELVNDKEDINQDNFPIAELAWDKIANLPRAERRGGGISKEVWEEFAKDYIEVMPAVTGKSAEQVGNAAKILLNKFNQVKTNKPVLKLLKEQLALYCTSSPNAETYEDCIKFLLDKADALLNMDEAQLLQNL